MTFLWEENLAVQCATEITVEEFSNYVAEKQWSQPSCILCHNSSSRFIKKFDSAELRVDTHPYVFYRIPIEQATLVDPTIPSTPHVRCYVGRSTPQVYSFTGGNLVKWMKSISVASRIHILQDDHFEILSKKSNVIAILVFPTQQYFGELEDLFAKLLDSHENDDIDVYFVPPGTNVERSLYEKVEIEALPSVFIYHRRHQHHKLRLLASLNGPYEVTEEFIQLHLLIHQLKQFHVSSGEFESLLSHEEYLRSSPVLFGIYSSSNPKSYPFLHAFRRTIESFHDNHHFMSNVRFVVVDISKMENNLVLTRNINHFSGWSIPFVLCVHSHKSDQGIASIKQDIMKGSSSPTLIPVSSFLQSHGLLVAVESSIDIWANMTCASGEYCFTGDNPLLCPPIRRRVKKQKRRVLGDHLRTINDESWDKEFVLTEQPSSMERMRGKEDTTSRFILVAFTKADCSYCQMVISEFQSLAKSIRYINGVSFFYMNCTSSPKKCSQYHVTGFPTLILFRVVTWFEHELCVPYETLLEPTRIDYHGLFKAAEILSWLNAHILPVVKIFPDSHSVPMRKNVRLVAHLYTKEFTEKYLHFSVRARVLPFRCFSLLCELLHARVECLGVVEHGSEHVKENTRLFVPSVEYFRTDGAHATLFRLGRTMESTLHNEHIGDSMFHKPHKYGISRQFKCEDDHVTCVRVMFEFIGDHIRLPITRVHTGMFHSHQKGSDYMWERPILLTLAHPENITKSAEFNKELYKMAVRLYQKVNVAVLDVVEYHDWSNAFVPRGYFSRLRIGEDPAMLRFPRFCLIDMDDHNHAAFYPPVKDESESAIQPGDTRPIDMAHIEMFVDAYIKDKSSVLMETEQF